MMKLYRKFIFYLYRKERNKIKVTSGVTSKLDSLSHLLTHWREWIELSRKNNDPDFDFTDDHVMNRIPTPCGVSTGMFKVWVETIEQAISYINEQLEEDELINKTIDLRWNSDMRAIKLWQEKTGRKLVWPDQEDLCIFLMEELDKLKG